MSRRLAILAAITLLVVVGAIWAVVTRQQATQADLGGTPVFPGLREKVADVARIEVGSDPEKVTLDRAGDGWTVAERAGYPANANRIQTLLVTLGDLVKLEPRTSLPERYAEIGVEDPAPKAGSTRVTLTDAKGAKLADLLVGKAQTGLAGGTSTNTYVRKPGEAQSWLAKGTFVLDRDPAAWLDKELLVLVRERVMRATITQADGAVLDVVRDKPTDDMFRIANVPEGRMPRTPTIAGPVANALGYLAAEDVRKADSLDMTKSPVVSVWRTFDGLVLTVTSVEVDGKVWARLDADIDPAQVEAAKSLDKVPSGDGTNLLKDEAAVRKEVDDLKAAWNGWAYSLEATKARDLRTKIGDLLAPEADKKPEGVSGAAPGAQPLPDDLPGLSAPIPGGPASQVPATP
jgi:hypothetical protein